MKGPCTLVASVLAASTAALTTTSAPGDRDVTLHPRSKEGLGRGKARDSCTPMSACDKEKFAPRFDGLRFIETLVTAHK